MKKYSVTRSSFEGTDLNHTRFNVCFPKTRMVLMAIDTTDNHWLSIDKQLLGPCRNFSNTHSTRFTVYDCTRWILKQYNKCVEVWLSRTSNEGVNTHASIHHKMSAYYLLSNPKKDRVQMSVSRS